MTIEISNSGKRVSWRDGVNEVSKDYDSTVMGYEVLPDAAGVLILEPYEIVGKNNAVIYSLDGSEYWRLPYTGKTGQGICFDRSGLRNGELTVFTVVSNRDVGVKVDWRHKEYSDVFSAR